MISTVCERMTMLINLIATRLFDSLVLKQIMITFECFHTVDNISVLYMYHHEVRAAF